MTRTTFSCLVTAAMIAIGAVVAPGASVGASVEAPVGFGTIPQDQQPRFEVGQPFPAIELPSLEDGTPTSLADFRGRKVLLHVFASW